jgi:hypothetical protein
MFTDHAAAGLQVGPGSPGEVEDQVDLVATGGIPILVADVLEFAEVRSASEIEDDVEPAELMKRKANEPRALRRIVKQAGLQRDHRATGSVNERGCLLGRLDADVAANDCGALAGEGQRGRAADASAGSGDEADLPR